ncbi:hypothetical protein EW146_g5251 [Bondarzewia mesenterica]|uniref:Uncharacterized protein n=1 Tax=Bondarzewia mesenterica TaxID=1095465 RepID=A0A4S4LS14_9AGAM|nr:hypothetical protein EW146_g5251 [Bondarzewia mesenterica]
MSSDSLPLSAGISRAYIYVQADVISVAFETGFYSLWAAFFALSTYFLACKGFSSRTNLTLWLVTFIMFLVSTCHYALGWVNRISDVLSDLPGLGEVWETQTFLPIINYNLSDAVLVWRAWVLWDRNIKVVIVPALTCFATAVVGFASAGLHIRALHSNGSLPFDGIFPDSVPILPYSLSLITNILATLLIAFKAWKYSQSIKAYLGNSSSPALKAGAILALLVESGFLYCAIWGIYPTVVIVLVSLRKTAWDMTASTEGIQNAHELSIRPSPAIHSFPSMNGQHDSPSVIQIGFNRQLTTHDDDNCKEEIAGAREESGIV